VGFYPFVLRRPAAEEMLDKSNLSFAPSLPARSRLDPCSRGNEERNGKAGFNYFPRNKKKGGKEEGKKKDRGYALGRED